MVPKVGEHSVQKLPKCYRVEEGEGQYVDIEEQARIEATRKPKGGEESPKRHEPFRGSTRKVQTPIKYKYYALMAQVMDIVEPSNYE